MHSKIICFVAGKSGGHIIPCLTIADNKKRAHDNEHINILFFSSDTPLDKAILSQDNRVTWHIMLPLSSRTGSRFKILWHAIKSFFMSFFYLCKHRPEEIITTGGIVAIPPCIAGFILRIPITLYSLDAIPGKAIQFLVPIATSIITPFANSQSYFPAHKCKVAPYPVKYQNMVLPDQATALHSLGLSPHKKTIVILGGSQGSLFLNNCTKTFIDSPYFDQEKTQIILQTGSANSINVSAYVFSYMPNLENIYSAADLIICRAGAGTLFEVHFFNKPCIIIPLETQTTTHQVDNAEAMASEYPELFYTILQREIENDPTVLYTRIIQMLQTK